MQGRKKTNKKNLTRGRAPTTRSRANSIPKPTNEEARETDETCQFLEPEISPHPDDGQGSMATSKKPVDTLKKRIYVQR